MATIDEVAQLRRLINDVDMPQTYTDSDLELLIDANGVNVSGAIIWREKAASMATLVDVQEGSSRRSLGDLYEQALSMAKFLEGADTGGSTMRNGTTRLIERP
jgi:hypothetical protein